MSTRIGLAALQYVPNSKGTILMPIDQISIRPGDEPPEDPECMRRLNLVF
jgi:hypothetical protein